MPPTWIIEYKCGAQSWPCSNGTAVIKMVNATSVTSPGGHEGEVTAAKEVYDHDGAMRFIVATVLVYSLIGVLGTLLLRIKRSATRAQRSIAVQEECLQRYIKHQEKLVVKGRRERMKIQAERVSRILQYGPSRQTSRDSNLSSESDPSLDDSSGSLFLSSSVASSQDFAPLSPRSPLFAPLGFSFREFPKPGLLPPLMEEEGGEAKLELELESPRNENESTEVDKSDAIFDQTIANTSTSTRSTTHGNNLRQMNAKFDYNVDLENCPKFSLEKEPDLDLGPSPRGAGLHLYHGQTECPSVEYKDRNSGSLRLSNELDNDKNRYTGYPPSVGGEARIHSNLPVPEGPRLNCEKNETIAEAADNNNCKITGETII